MIYRVKQIIWAIICSCKSIDYNYVDKFLNKQEQKIFRRLKKSEQHHSIRVSNEAIKLLNNNKYIELDKKEVIKASLLHDIGKIKYPMNLIEKVLLVILNKITKGKIKKISSVLCIDIYYNHPKYSVEILKNLKSVYSNSFIEAINEHHNNDLISNNLLNILREADNKS
ncbi:HD domain-containing protein [Clostridium tarantellae]|uniref:HD domain-containing protein n=1 Tax=Clostridium tarantellae TaxID=39493 RepID=UPI00128B0EC5|nr:HD domain-containing protein [Clostridium tarantellae]